MVFMADVKEDLLKGEESVVGRSVSDLMSDGGRLSCRVQVMVTERVMSGLVDEAFKRGFRSGGFGRFIRGELERLVEGYVGGGFEEE